MPGAIGIYFVAYRLSRRMRSPILAESFSGAVNVDLRAGVVADVVHRRFESTRILNRISAGLER